MNTNAVALTSVALAASLLLGGSPALAHKRSVHKPTAEESRCAQSAGAQGLTGAGRADFVKSCVKGPLAAKTPTAPTASSKEAQAVTKPSGVDRTTRTNQCAAEADRKGLTDKNRSAFQLSCLATAGPVSEGETGVKEPHPANQIKGIGVNNYKPSTTTAKSTPQP